MLAYPWRRGFNRNDTFLVWWMAYQRTFECTQSRTSCFSILNVKIYCFMKRQFLDIIRLEMRIGMKNSNSDETIAFSSCRLHFVQNLDISNWWWLKMLIWIVMSNQHSCRSAGQRANKRKYKICDHLLVNKFNILKWLALFAQRSGCVRVLS